MTSANTTLMAAGFAIALWWLGTLAVMIVSRRGHIRDGIMRITSIGMYVGGMVGIAMLQSSTQLYAIFGSFTLAVLVWGALEISYFRGWVTGPRRKPCPENASHSKRFMAGLMTSLHHELAVLGTAATLIFIGQSGDHRTGTGAFVILWLMRWSAKLNLFFGVRNFSNEMLPESMRYLSSYVRRARLNAFFPVSIIAASLALLILVAPAIQVDAIGHGQIAASLLSTLLVLAIIEHLFLVVPFSDWPLWQWSLRKLALSNYSVDIQSSDSLSSTSKSDGSI